MNRPPRPAPAPAAIRPPRIDPAARAAADRAARADRLARSLAARAIDRAAR